MFKISVLCCFLHIKPTLYQCIFFDWLIDQFIVFLCVYKLDGVHLTSHKTNIGLKKISHYEEKLAQLRLRTGRLSCVSSVKM